MAVIGGMASEFEEGNLSSHSARTLAEALLDGVLEMGATGKLDDCLVTDAAMRDGLIDVDVGGDRIGTQGHIRL